MITVVVLELLSREFHSPAEAGRRFRPWPVGFARRPRRRSSAAPPSPRRTAPTSPVLSSASALRPRGLITHGLGLCSAVATCLVIAVRMRKLCVCVCCMFPCFLHVIPYYPSTIPGLLIAVAYQLGTTRQKPRRLRLETNARGARPLIRKAGKPTRTTPARSGTASPGASRPRRPGSLAPRRRRELVIGGTVVVFSCICSIIIIMFN